MDGRRQLECGENPRTTHLGVGVNCILLRLVEPNSGRRSGSLLIVYPSFIYDRNTGPTLLVKPDKLT
jgi:hypothetical protein